MDCLEMIVPHPTRGVNPSEAVLCRKVEADNPVLFFDEIDTAFSGASAVLIALLVIG